MQFCAVEGCDDRIMAKGLCVKHYTRNIRYGTTDLLDRRRSISERFWPKVEKTEGCWNWTGSKDRHGYGRLAGEGKGASPKRSHRVSFELANGPIPNGMDIDHICHNPACVKPDHLRAATRKENMENRSGPQRNSTSGVLGVTWAKKANAWKAQVAHNKKNLHIGYYSTLEEAESAVIAKRLELFTHNDRDRQQQRAA